MKRKKMPKKIYMAAAGMLLLALLIQFGVWHVNERTERKNIPKSGTEIEEKESVPKSGTAERKEEPALIFFQEENLFFLSESAQEQFKAEFAALIKSEMIPGDVTCCTVLSNVRSLSNRTFLFYVQTNAPVGNLYQVIANDGEQFFDMEVYGEEIPDIEVYGGAAPDDSIERIYLYGDGGVKKEIEIPSLEEESEEKEKNLLLKE